MKRAVAIVFILIAGLVMLRGLSVSNNAGQSTTLFAQFDGACARATNLGGADDIAVDWASRRVYAIGPAGVRAVGLDDPDADLTPPGAQISGKGPRLTHAIDLVLMQNEESARQAWSARIIDDRVVITPYAVSGAAPVAGDGLVTDIAAGAEDFLSLVVLDAETLVVAIASRPARGLLDAMVGGLGRRNGRLILVRASGAEATTTEIADDLRTPAGLAYDAATGALFVAEVGARALAIWTQDAAGGFAFVERAPIGNAAGRLALDEQDRIWAAMHPKTLTWLKGKSPAPTQVGVLEPTEKRGDQVFLSLGEDLSAGVAAVADPDIQRLLIFGQGDYGLSCQLPEVWRHSDAYPASRPEGSRQVGGRAP